MKIRQLINKFRSRTYQFRKTLRIFFHIEMKNLVLHGALSPRRFYIHPAKKLAYLRISKAACSSIKMAMFDVDADDDYSIHEKTHGFYKYRLDASDRDLYTFSFVRDPFSRLVSCYTSKYHRDRAIGKRFDFDHYLLGILKKDPGFEVFVRKVSRIPDFLADKHFKSQYRSLYDRKGRCLVDSIGHFETIEQDFEPLRQRFELSELPHYNKSGTDRWMVYYSPQTIELVARRYRRDIAQFGYEDVYQRLCQFCSEPHSKQG